MNRKTFISITLFLTLVLFFLACDSKTTKPEDNYEVSTWICYPNWTQASPPTSSDSALYYYSQIGKINWYNPYDKVYITDIWPQRDVNSQTVKAIDVLSIKFEPNLNNNYSWDGIMRTYPEDEALPVDTGYIEFWILSDTSGAGTLHFDIGRISEDWWLLGSNYVGRSSLGNLNTEDINMNGILDDGEDRGIDGREYSQQPSEWPDDRWRQPDKNANDYSGINGTEGNSSAKGYDKPDSEDLNGDGQVDLANDYFEYSFSLDRSSPDTVYIDSLNSSGWTKYKIPLNNPTKIVGNPSWLDIEYARLWIDKVTGNSMMINIAQIKLTN